MGLQEIEPMTQLIDAAQRLRLVRSAERRFLVLWTFEREAKRPAERRRNFGRQNYPSALRQRRLFDDL
jgi:hypothetical protein